MTDSRGQPLDFGQGRTLGENFGVIAVGKDVHAQMFRKFGRKPKPKCEQFLIRPRFAYASIILLNKLVFKCV